MKLTAGAAAGMLLLGGAAQFVVGLFLSEALYPGYGVGTNPVSDLGATCHADLPCVVLEPASTIFTIIMLVLGAVVLLGAALLARAIRDRLLSAFLAAAGLGILGAGIFDETWGAHGIFALFAFAGGSTAALVSVRSEPGPVRYAYAALGGVAWVGFGWQLLGTFVGAQWFGSLGDGGVERIIVYPVLVWLLVLGTTQLTRAGFPPSEARSAATGPVGSEPGRPGPTTDDLIEVTKAIYRSFDRRDIPGVLGFLSPDVVWEEPDNPVNPSGGSRHGHAGFLEWAKIGNEAEEVLRLEPDAFLRGPDSVAVIGRTTCRVRRTGKAYSTEFVHLVRFKDGKVVGFREFFDTYAAAEAFRPG